MQDPGKRRFEKFDGDAGSFISAADAKSYTRAYREYEERIGNKPDEITKAEFFGINRINRLLGRKDCVGVRIYYGKRQENADGDPATERDEQTDLKSRLVLVGVRADGSDIFEDPEGLKDMPKGDGDALANGHLCPDRC